MKIKPELRQDLIKNCGNKNGEDLVFYFEKKSGNCQIFCVNRSFS